MSGPAYTEVQVLVPVGWQELVADVLAGAPCTGIAFGPRSLASPPPPDGHVLVRAFFDERDDDAALRTRLTGALASLAERAGARELEGLAPVFARLPPEDWATTWRKVWRPLRVGRVCVVPPDRAGGLRPDDVRLELEPGAAFGTGRHATTRGCLRELQRQIRPGDRVLDAGCGTGILAVAACLLGAERAVGFDVDRAAVEHSRELAERNGVGGRCTFLQGSFEALAELGGGPGARFDGCLANLYADLIRTHAGDLAARLDPGGWFVFSGCLTKYREGVAAELARAGLALERRDTRGRWDVFTGRLDQVS